MTADLSALHALVWANVETLLWSWLFCRQCDCFFYRFGLRAFGQCAGWGEFPLEKCKQTFKAGTGPRRKKRHLLRWRKHRRDGEEGPVTCASRRNRRNLEGNSKYTLTGHHIWSSPSPFSITTQNPNHPSSPSSSPAELGWTRQLQWPKPAPCIHGNKVHP